MAPPSPIRCLLAHLPIAVVIATGCARSPSEGAHGLGIASSAARSSAAPAGSGVFNIASSSSARLHPRPALSLGVQRASNRASAARASTEASGSQDPPAGSTELRELRFAWRPQGAKVGEYAMSNSLDQHQIVIMPGVVPGSPPAVLALHGQPRRGTAPRDYTFPGVVVEAARRMVEAGEVRPLVLLVPRFRFEGQNWPAFALDGFMTKANEVLSREGIILSHPYVLGHSGAAGCGGGGLNHAEGVQPSAVAFLDTCVGPSFGAAVRELERSSIPVLILHSVETAGFRPRQPVEYQPDFDFGRVYGPLGLSPASCPASVPDAPLRPLAYRCASSASGNTRAFVVDTGDGEDGHNAIVPVGLRYFLKEYVGTGAAAARMP